MHKLTGGATGLGATGWGDVEARPTRAVPCVMLCRHVLCLLSRSTYLYARVGLMHKLKELVDHSLEELPVCAQKLWVLTNNIPVQVGRWLGVCYVCVCVCV